MLVTATHRVRHRSDCVCHVGCRH